MSRQLVESIIDKDFVLSESHFNDRLDAIMEKKLYEKKRQVATQMDEVMGGMSPEEARKKYTERGQKPRRASDVYGDPRDIKIGSSSKGTEQPKRRKAAPAAPKSTEKTSAGPEVQPDTEARVRGGKTKAQPLLRKLAAKTIRLGKKYGGSEFRKSYLQSKQQTQAASDAASVDADQEKRRKAPPKSAELRDKPITSREKFVNALKGREINYRKEKETDPNKKPGVAGFLGKVARGALQGAESGLHSMEE